MMLPRAVIPTESWVKRVLIARRINGAAKKAKPIYTIGKNFQTLVARPNCLAKCKGILLMTVNNRRPVTVRFIMKRRYEVL
jgi:hypothetical protein